MHISSSRFAAVVVAGLFAFTGCGSDEAASVDAGSNVTDTSGASADASQAETVTFVDAWSRQPVAGQSTSAVYGQIINDGEEAITMIAARTSVTDRAELHEVLVGDGGAMTMQQRNSGFVVPAGGSLVLEPGSFHVMLLDVDPATYPDTVELEVDFGDGTTLEVTAAVRPVEMDADMDMDHDMDMDDDMDMDE